jgi:2-phospho-L-lactate guanylyltransferase
VRWTVVIPAKALPAAKSRLLPALTDPAAHRSLVLAIREDTLAAAQRASSVARVLLAVDRPQGAPAGVREIVQSRPGLNAALAEVAEHAATVWPEDGVAALVGDLPALQPEELDAALASASAHARAFVPDAAGTGTTLLAAAPGHALGPAFGAGSAARHRQDAFELPAGAGLRHDVDTAEDLISAGRLPLGPATSAALAAIGVTVRSP